MNILTTILGLVTPALNVLSAFTGNAQAAKASAVVQDAVGVVTALVPLVQQFGRGDDVTEDDVRTALAGMDTQIAKFDEAIKAAGEAG